MNTEFYYPDSLTGTHLDDFLAAGWYRMHQGLFTTHFIVQHEQVYRVFWLRYNLELFSAGNTVKKIITANKQFTVTIKPLVLTEELEALYNLYKTGIDFDGASSIKTWLYGEEGLASPFDTCIVEIRHDGLLIAAGIFDVGHNSVAGIINFYHPAYKKYSPGKYLMIQKIQYAVTTGKQWYYPGYIVHNYPKFDYKLFAGMRYCEVFIPGVNKWYPYNKRVVDVIGEQSFIKEE